MMKISDWLDTKVGKLIRRVYMLALLFVSNAILVIGAAMYYLYQKSGIVLVIGVIGTIICIGILSAPTNLNKQLHDN